MSMLSGKTLLVTDAAPWNGPDIFQATLGEDRASTNLLLFHTLSQHNSELVITVSGGLTAID